MQNPKPASFGLESVSFSAKMPAPEWSRLNTRGEAPSPRYGHAECFVGGSRMYVHGGRADERKTFSSELHVLEVGSRTWRYVGASNPPSPRGYHSLNALGSQGG